MSLTRRGQCGIILSQQHSLCLHNWHGSYWVESFAECVISFFPIYLSALTILRQSSNQKVDGSFIATVLETASVGVLYLAWRSITEGVYSKFIILINVIIIYVCRNMGRWICLLILFHLKNILIDHLHRRCARCQPEAHLTQPLTVLTPSLLCCPSIDSSYFSPWLLYCITCIVLYLQVLGAFQCANPCSHPSFTS